jgi:hypothetical protein
MNQACPSRVLGKRPICRPKICALACVALAFAGCGSVVDTTYGRSRSQSINGTAVLADLFRAHGHEVRRAFRLTDELSNWADVIVRFAQAPGPPPQEEAAWYGRWTAAGSTRSIVYVPRDYDAEQEYWQRALEQLPATETQRTRERIEEARKAASGWESHLPTPAKSPASAREWFAVEPATSAPVVCSTLGGPWAKGLDPARAALTRHQVLKVQSEQVLLSGDQKPLVIDWQLDIGGRVLVAASGVFLLNLPLTEPARWPLAARTVEWTERAADGPIETRKPLRVAFVEGGHVLTAPTGPPSPFEVLKIPPFGRVAAQLFLLGLAACLARAPRLGRPHPEEPSGADRPVAHPEALGALLARARQGREARAILEAYRRWRSAPAGRGHHPHPVAPVPPAGNAARNDPLPEAPHETGLANNA